VLLNQLSPQLANLPSAFDQQDKQFSRAFAVIREAIEQRAFPAATLAVTHRR
jgi:hypothetical protein